MTTIIKEYFAKLIAAGKREEDRNAEQYREINIEEGAVWQACGSARVKIGETDVLVGVTMNVGTPFPDSPDSGVLMVNAELNPLASADFELGPPRENAIELARVVDRMVREAKVIDMDKLCITPKEKVWMVFIDIQPINADGNLFDAAGLAAMVALTNAKIPKYDKKEEQVVFGEFSKDKLPVRATPMMCTFGKINGNLFLDPTAREEDVMDARINIATTADGHVHGMQKGGTGVFTENEILKLVALATEKGKELRKLLK